MEASNTNRNYYVSFIAGIIVFIVGLILKMTIVWAIGIVFFIYGIINRSKWPRRLETEAAAEEPAAAEPVAAEEEPAVKDEPATAEEETTDSEGPEAEDDTGEKAE